MKAQALWLKDALGVHVDTMMDLVALMGILLSAMTVVLRFHFYPISRRALHVARS